MTAGDQKLQSVIFHLLNFGTIAMLSDTQSRLFKFLAHGVVSRVQILTFFKCKTVYLLFYSHDKNPNLR